MNMTEKDKKYFLDNLNIDVSKAKAKYNSLSKEEREQADIKSKEISKWFNERPELTVISLLPKEKMSLRDIAYFGECCGLFCEKFKEPPSLFIDILQINKHIFMRKNDLLLQQEEDAPKITKKPQEQKKENRGSIGGKNIEYLSKLKMELTEPQHERK